MNKNLLVIGICGVLAFLGVWFYSKHSQITKPIVSAPNIRLNESLDVSYINVLEGHEFDVRTTFGLNFHIFLSRRCVPEAKEKVIKLIHKSQHPRIVILSQMEGVDPSWVADVYLTIEGKERNLLDWLGENRLLLADKGSFTK